MTIPTKKNDAHLHLRVGKELKRLLARAARKAGCDNESTWIRRVLAEAAQRELGK